MKNKTGDLFAGHRRREKLMQFTKVLEALTRLVDWAALAQVVNDATGCEAPQPKGGRPPYATQAMMKIIVLQQIYGNLSDEEMEYALLDRTSWQQFVGLAEARDLPDACTIWAFKNQLAQAGGAVVLFAEVQRQLAAAGLIAKGGQMIDATIITAPKVQLNKDEKQTVDRGETPARLLHGKTIHADRGDMTVLATQAYSKTNTSKTALPARMIAAATTRVTCDIHRRNRKLSRIRARAEHVFGS